MVINSPPIAEEMSGKPVVWANWFMQAYRILFDVQNSGTSAARPLTSLYVGKFYYDTTLGLPIWYKGPGWIKADGTAA